MPLWYVSFLDWALLLHSRVSISQLCFLESTSLLSQVLEEAGHMDLCDGETERDKWKNQSRLNEIIGNITRGRSRGAWMAVLGVVGFCFLALGAGAIGTSEAAQQGSDDRQFIYLNDFAYTQSDSIRYPSCQLTSDLGESPITTMAGKFVKCVCLDRTPMLDERHEVYQASGILGDSTCPEPSLSYPTNTCDVPTYLIRT